MKLEKISNRLLVVICGIILFFLALNSMFFTQRCGIEANGEIINGAPIYREWNNPIFNIIGIGIICCIFIGLYYIKVIEQYKKKCILLFQIFIAVLIGILSFFILEGGIRTPIADQIQVYSAARLFNEGLYVNLEKGGYLDLYPQQLGYVAYLQMILKIFGNDNFYAVQVINCAFISGIVIAISLCLNELADNNMVRVAGSIFIIPVLPLYLLSSWVYGDIPSLFFIFLGLYFFIRFLKYDKKYYMILLIICMCISVLLRKNSLIIMIACGIVLILVGYKKRQPILFLTAFLIIILPLISIEIVENHYEKVSGYEIEGGLPSVMWITMGMIEGNSKPGWFNNYSVPIYYEAECNRELAADIAVQELYKQLSFYVDNPINALSFYKRKICTQWNDPFYNTNFLISVDEGETSHGITEIMLKNCNSFHAVLATYQFIIYLGTFMYCLKVALNNSLYKNIFLVAFIGGFLFSILWEANSRYVFPYILMLIPLAVLGWNSAICSNLNLKNNVDNLKISI